MHTNTRFSCHSAVDVGGMQPAVILGVAASDAHAVANQLIAHYLRAYGYRVINLGTCTPVAEFADALDEHHDTIAVIVGSLNGHAYEDLHDLAATRAAGRLQCPVIVGGNLSVGSRKDTADIKRLFNLGVDYILSDIRQLPSLLDSLAQKHATATFSVRNAS
jgi:methylaspartate mutase sigma subunit